MTSPANETPASHSPPAVLSAAQRHDLARQFESAKQLTRKSPPDFASVHRVLSECCTLDPGNTLFTAALLENLHRANGKTATVWFWKVWKLRAEFDAALQAKHWRLALVAGWRLLGERPRDSAVLFGLSQVCGELDHLLTQIQLLQAACRLGPANETLLAAWAKALAAAGQFAESAHVWRRWLEHFKGTEALQYLEAMRETEQVGPGGHVFDESLPLGARVSKLIRDQQWDAAENLLGSHSGAVGADLELRSLGEELSVGRARQRVTIAERLMHLSPTSRQRRLAEEMTEELQRIELGVAFARYERFPSEPASSFELAACLTRAKNFSEALKYLSPLIAHEKWRTQALVATAENWQHLRQFDRALQAYRDALEVPQLDPQDEHVQRGWFRGAVLAEASRQPELAVAWLERLTAANSGYKDAAARLDNLRVICNKGGFSAHGADQSRGA
jgi:tetratricopeptide (TPR) repeat protein